MTPLNVFYLIFSCYIVVSLPKELQRISYEKQPNFFNIYS